MINKTKDYAMFKMTGGNRMVRTSHVRRLVASISEHNMLSKNPIVVDHEMNVIDGQHRLAAAEQLGKFVYYIVADGYNFRDIVLLNNNSKQWDVEDYLNAYVSQGKEDYLTLSSFSRKYELPISISVMLLENKTKRTRAGYRRFAEGDFEIVDLLKATAEAELVVRTKQYTEGIVWKNRDYINALRVVMAKFEADTIINKLSGYGDIIKRQRTSKDYLRQFEDVFNKFRRGTPVRFF